MRSYQMGHMQCTVASDNNSGLSMVLGNRDILDSACKITSCGVRGQKPDHSKVNSRVLIKHGS